MCRNAQVPTEELRDSNIEILQNFKFNVLARQEKLKNREKKTILNILSCLKTRDAVGSRGCIQRIEQLLVANFSLPEDSTESEVSVYFAF